MTPVDPDSVTDAVRTANTINDHIRLFLRDGLLSIFFGSIGGTIAFFLSARQRRFNSKWSLAVVYFTKVLFGCASAYLALLAFPIFGIGLSTEAEQVVAILAAILGSDFIGVLLKRIFGMDTEDMKEIASGGKNDS